jgi:hypothetical protein
VLLQLLWTTDLTQPSSLIHPGIYIFVCIYIHVATAKKGDRLDPLRHPNPLPPYTVAD